MIVAQPIKILNFFPHYRQNSRFDLAWLTKFAIFLRLANKIRLFFFPVSCEIRECLEFDRQNSHFSVPDWQNLRFFLHLISGNFDFSALDQWNSRFFIRIRNGQFFRDRSTKFVIFPTMTNEICDFSEPDKGNSWFFWVRRRYLHFPPHFIDKIRDFLNPINEICDFSRWSKKFAFFQYPINKTRYFTEPYRRIRDFSINEIQDFFMPDL